VPEVIVCTTKRVELEVTAIDISSNAIQACSLRGIKDARVQDVMTLENETYDTILLLMNGAGMWETKKYSEFPTKTKITLNPGGQILLDSPILSICLMMMKMEEMDSIR
jgi:hypothetical protein